MGKELGHNPQTDFVQRGLISDRDVIISGFHWDKWDYMGTLAPGKPPGLALMADAVAMDDSSVTEDMKWSAGSSTEIRPINDGQGIEAVKEGVEGLSNNCNAYHFFQSLLDAGLDSELLDKPVSALNGIEVHILRKKFTRTGSGDVAKESDVPIVTAIVRAPGEAERKKGGGKGGGKKASGGKKGAAGSAASADDNGDVGKQTAELIATVLAAEEDDVTMSTLPGLVVRAAITAGIGKGPREAIKLQASDESYVDGIEGIQVVDGIVASA